MLGLPKLSRNWSAFSSLSKKHLMYCRRSWQSSKDNLLLNLSLRATAISLFCKKCIALSAPTAMGSIPSPASLKNDSPGFIFVCILVINALKVPSSSEQISIELTDNASFGFNLKILSFDSSPPPSLAYSPSFKESAYSLCPPFVEEGDWLILIALFNFKFYRLLE